jgi:hypothetical protein
MTENIEASTSRIPSYAKLIIIVQTLVIAYFAFWSYEEYLNNAYFQNYVNASLQGSSFAIVALSSVGIFTAVASGLYMKLRRTRRELEDLVSTEPSSAGRESGSVLAPHVEQHLIEMIRKSNPPDTTGSSGLPVLKREDQPSGQAR